jgi:hypothetical protein
MRHKKNFFANLIEARRSHMEQTLREYRQVMQHCRSLFEKKMHDYGVAWRILRLPSLTDQIFIKASRIKTLEQGRENKVGESIASEYVGIVNYCVMALIQCELGVAEEPDLTPENTLQRYDQEVEKCIQLMQQKNNDYGEAWREMRVSSLTDLILMKLHRTKQIEDNAGNTLISEGVEANYRDMLNYAVFALIKLD